MDNFTEDDLEELSSAEDFLEFFGVEYDAGIVHVNRLHILQRYHDYLSKAVTVIPNDGCAAFDARKALLERAYRDFVDSDALTERVFKVLKDAGHREAFGTAAFVGLGDISVSSPTGREPT